MRIIGYNGDEKVFEIEPETIKFEMATGAILFSPPHDCKVTRISVESTINLEEGVIEASEEYRFQPGWVAEIVKHWQSKILEIQEAFPCES